MPKKTTHSCPDDSCTWRRGTQSCRRQREPSVSRRAESPPGAHLTTAGMLTPSCVWLRPICRAMWSVMFSVEWAPAGSPCGAPCSTACHTARRARRTEDMATQGPLAVSLWEGQRACCHHRTPVSAWLLPWPPGPRPAGRAPAPPAAPCGRMLGTGADPVSSHTLAGQSLARRCSACASVPHLASSGSLLRARRSHRRGNSTLYSSSGAASAPQRRCPKARLRDGGRGTRVPHPKQLRTSPEKLLGRGTRLGGGCGGFCCCCCCCCCCASTSPLPRGA